MPIYWVYTYIPIDLRKQKRAAFTVPPAVILFDSGRIPRLTWYSADKTARMRAGGIVLYIF